MSSVVWGDVRLFFEHASLSDELTFDPIAEACRQWKKHWGAAPVASVAVVTSLMRVQQILTAELNALVEPYDLTFARYEALMLLYYSKDGKLPLGKMGARLQVHRTSVTNLVDGLEKSGFVKRKSHPTDRRTTLAILTPTGRKIAQDSTKVMNEIKFAVGTLRKSEMLELTALLEKVRFAAGDIVESS